MGLCGRKTVSSSEGLTRKMTFQHHLRAPREDEVIKEAGGVSCIVESEFPYDGETDPSMGGRSGCLCRVGEAKFDGFERRTPFEEEY